MFFKMYAMQMTCFTNLKHEDCEAVSSEYGG